MKMKKTGFSISIKVHFQCQSQSNFPLSDTKIKLSTKSKRVLKFHLLKPVFIVIVYETGLLTFDFSLPTISLESGSTAQNATARISTARHFFQESRLLDRKMSSARQKKVCRTCSTCQFRAVDKKSASARIFEKMTKFLRQ